MQPHTILPGFGIMHLVFANEYQETMFFLPGDPLWTEATVGRVSRFACVHMESADYMLDIMIPDMIVAMLMDLVMNAKVPW